MAEDTVLDPELQMLSDFRTESENLRRRHDHTWAENTKLSKGIFSNQDNTVSKVRNRNKTFFRKIWATVWRLTASMYNAFLRDQDNFNIEGRDTVNDYLKARVLHKMTAYRRDKMMRNDSLFKKMLWFFQNILNLGFAVGKLRWDFRVNKDGVIERDEPKFTVYPNEQVFPDFSAETREQMRYIGFLNYMSLGEMKELGFENISDVQPTTPESNTLRHARYLESRLDPLHNPKTTGDYQFPRGQEYPQAGKYPDDNRDIFRRAYKVFEWFYMENGRVKYCATHDNRIWAKKPIDSPYDNANAPYTNIIMGDCLTEAHQLVGEGFPEPLKGPQESYNYNLNMRKDNIALSMTRQAIVSRFANVDLQSVVNRRAGAYTLADDVNAIRYEDVPDVTQSAYMESASDEQMMEEMSGVTPGKQGLERTDKATVAQINYAEANAKIDLFIAIIGESVKDFFSGLAKMIQRFETDENVFRIANESLRKELNDPNVDVYDLDFEADCIINVGLGTVGRDNDIKQTLLLWDRAIMSNQASAALLQSGAIPPEEGIRMIDVTKFFETIAPKMGYKNLKELFFNVKPPPQEAGAGGLDPALAGRTQPQIGDLGIQAETPLV